jgi:outer membrane immunogenic protein
MKVTVFATATAAALAGFGAITAASAQTIDEPVFTGLRVEGFAGYNRSAPQFRSFGANPSTSRPQKHTGGIAGGLVGFDYQLGPVVAGVFGSYAMPTESGCGTLSGTNYGCLTASRQIEGGARVGITRMGALLYLKGAYVNTSIKTDVRDGPDSINSSYINRDGWRAGAGAEYALNRHFYVKAEYDYTRTKRFDVSAYGFPNSDVRYKNHMVLGGFGVRF